MTPRSVAEYLDVLRPRYRRASRSEKAAMRFFRVSIINRGLQRGNSPGASATISRGEVALVVFGGVLRIGISIHKADHVVTTCSGAGPLYNSYQVFFQCIPPLVLLNVQGRQYSENTIPLVAKHP